MEFEYTCGEHFFIVRKLMSDPHPDVCAICGKKGVRRVHKKPPEIIYAAKGYTKRVYEKK